MSRMSATNEQNEQNERGEAWGTAKDGKMGAQGAGGIGRCVRATPDGQTGFGPRTSPPPSRAAFVSERSLIHAVPAPLALDSTVQRCINWGCAQLTNVFGLGRLATVPVPASPSVWIGAGWGRNRGRRWLRLLGFHV